MSDPVLTASRATAERLAPTYGPQLHADVEAALYSRANSKHEGEPIQYTDPIALAALILQAAEFAWNYCREHRTTHDKPLQADTLTRRVSTHISETRTLDDGTRRVIEITVEETLKALPPTE
ncbi:hypothetical protein KDL01_32795 [Actinospica durhamensis]|uniref:Uncharacterized protein n=1 Tax=Actinospica durhamensis TaxID=1508375 RepID=A0A941EU18_9ACTN|nr:hypothetical protein [Actinospica durhamensis]MBR7838097.1 hypothetical protein [Actinospica durhamensis]